MLLCPAQFGILGKQRATPRPFRNVEKMINVLMVTYVYRAEREVRWRAWQLADCCVWTKKERTPNAWHASGSFSPGSCVARGASGRPQLFQLFLSMVHRELEEPIMLHQTNHSLHITLDRYVPNQFSPNAELSYQG